MDGTIRIVTLPDDDVDFHRVVTEALDKLRRGSLDGQDARAVMIELVQRLLPNYPGLDVRQQESLASFEADPRTWYVYRDGTNKHRLDGAGG